MSGRPWTEDELRIVERNYPTYGCNVDAWPERIDRTKMAVRDCARKHGIRFRYPHGLTCVSEEQADKLAEAWLLVARHLRADPKRLIGDLCVLRHRGAFET